MKQIEVVAAIIRKGYKIFATRRHQHQRITTFYGVLYNLFLHRSEGVITII